MVVADLHVHTTVSDGTLSLADLPAAAERAGLEAVAVTDHDRTHPALSRPVEVRGAVTIIAGIELRVETPEQRLDLLAYGLEPTADLRAELDRLQRDRVERGRQIVECVEARLGCSIDVSLEAGVGRPHVARAVVASPETDYETVDAVFADLIGEAEPCYEPRDVPDIAEALPLLAESSALVSLAHPFRYPDPAAALERAAPLDAVEAYYPYDGDRGHDGGPVDADLLADAIDRYDLLETGGSDAHGTTLGAAGLSAADYAPVAARLPDP